MSAGIKKVILFVWLLISIAILGAVLLGALDYYESTYSEVTESVLLRDDSNVAGMHRVYLDQYIDNLKKTVAYLAVNIGMTIFAIWSIKG